MSTKTTLKRIALVAVSVLGLGGLSVAVAPSASATSVSSLIVGTVPTARVGETVVVPVTINLTSIGSASETTVVAARVSSAPSLAGGQTMNSELGITDSSTNAASDPRLWLTVNPDGSRSGTAQFNAETKGTDGGADNTSLIGTFVAGTTTAGNMAAGGTAGGVAASAIQATQSATSAAVTVYLAMRPDVAGSYTVLVSATNGRRATNPSFSFEAGVGVSGTVSISTGGAPSTVTMTNLTGTTSAEAAASYGALVRVNLNGQLTGDEAINVTTSSGQIVKATFSGGVWSSGTLSATSTARMTKDDFVNGVGFVNVKPAAGATATVTATGTGSLAAITNNITVAAATGTNDLSLTGFLGRSSTTVLSTGWAAIDADATSAASAGSATVTEFAINATATSSTIAVSFTNVDEDATYHGVLAIRDMSCDIAQIACGSDANNLFMDKSFAVAFTASTTDTAVTSTTISITHSALGASSSTGDTYSFDDPIGSAAAFPGFTVVGRTAEATSSLGAVAVTPTPVRIATGGSIAIKATVTSQFNTALVGTAVTTSVAGRNGTRASEVQTTSSLGEVTSTIVDAGTAGATDTVTFTTTGGATGTATITWGAFTVGTVTVTGGYTASDTYKGQNTRAISTAVAGPHGDPVSITATVRDADGNVLAGVPVTFTVSKGLIRKTTTTDFTTVYTGATGTASTSVIDWTEGEQVITATAGGKSGTDYLTWEAKTASSARSISGVASGNKVTATVMDRYGNTVRGVVVNAKTSAGYFGSGTSSTTGTTDEDGAVSFFLNGANGAATVTLSLDKDTYPQSIDKAGQVGGTAVTAVTAGTTVGTGASLSAAGINSVDVRVTVTDAAATAAEAASDAALEAIDAANAATDAANLAAEAADAATVAAEEARDAADAATAAVEALASEVATLIAGLKAQITTLANTVAKIAKRVRA